MMASFCVQDCGLWSKPVVHSKLVRSTTRQQLSQAVLATSPIYTPELTNIKALTLKAQ